MTNADDIPLGPESQFIVLGEVLNFRSGRVTIRRMSHQHNDSGNPDWDQSIPGRRRMDVNVSLFADKTVMPVADLQVMADNVRYLDVQVLPYGSGEGGGKHSPTFEFETCSWDSPAEQGSQVTVELVGHSSGPVLDL